MAASVTPLVVSSAVSVSDYPIFRYKSGGLPSIGRHYLRRYYRGGYGKLDDEMDGQNIDRLVDRNTVVLSKTKSEDNRRREGGKNGKKRPEVLETPRQPVNQPGIRKAFADTALWAPAVTTNGAASRRARVFMGAL